METPLVSVLMAVYNAEVYLSQAIESLLSQTYRNWELLAVDDASSDGSLTLLQQYAAKDERIRVISQTENQGQAVARNEALRASRGEWICMLDADDWFSADALQLAVERIGATDADCVLFSLVEHRGETVEPYDMAMTPDDILSGTEAFTLSLDWQLHGLYVVRRDLHMRYPYDTRQRLYSDDNTCRWHYLHSRTVACCRGEYHYRRHAESATESLTAKRFLYMHANYDALQTMREEGVDAELLARYELVRWHNYLGQLRLYHSRGGELPEDERKQVYGQLCRMYKTFDRKQPFALFAFRQWLGYLYHRIF